MEAQDAPLAHPRGRRGPLEPAGLGLTSSSWPWSHLIHLWTCSGCSCPQSGKQRDCLDCAIREGALTCLGSFLPRPGSSSILSFTSSRSPTLSPKPPQTGSRILVVFSPPTPILLETLRRPERKQSHPSHLRCTDGILGSMARERQSPQVTKAECCPLSAVSVGKGGHHWAPGLVI